MADILDLLEQKAFLKEKKRGEYDNKVVAHNLNCILDYAKSYQQTFLLATAHRGKLEIDNQIENALRLTISFAQNCNIVFEQSPDLPSNIMATQNAPFVDISKLPEITDKIYVEAEPLDNNQVDRLPRQNSTRQSASQALKKKQHFWDNVHEIRKNPRPSGLTVLPEFSNQALLTGNGIAHYARSSFATFSRQVCERGMELLR